MFSKVERKGIQRGFRDSSVFCRAFQGFFFVESHIHIMADMFPFGKGVQRIFALARAFDDEDVFAAFFPRKSLGQTKGNAFLMNF